MSLMNLDVNISMQKPKHIVAKLVRMIRDRSIWKRNPFLNAKDSIPFILQFLDVAYVYAQVTVMEMITIFAQYSRMKNKKRTGTYETRTKNTKYTRFKRTAPTGEKHSQ